MWNMVGLFKVLAILSRMTRWHLETCYSARDYLGQDFIRWHIKDTLLKKCISFTCYDDAAVESNPNNFFRKSELHKKKMFKGFSSQKNWEYGYYKSYSFSDKEWIYDLYEYITI